MKTIYYTLLTIAILGISFTANTKGLSHYYSVEFSDSLTSSDIADLKKNGFEIIQKLQNGNIVVVKTEEVAHFSKQLKNRIKKFRALNKSEEQQKSTSQTPEFGKLFFNFI